MRKFILIFTIFISFNQLGFCCFCNPPSIKQIISYYYDLGHQNIIIFKGRLIYNGQDTISINRHGRYPTVHIFEIEKSWLGLDTTVKFIKLYDEGNSCDYHFIKDSVYFVHASQAGNEKSECPFYFTNECSRTKLFSEAKTDTDSLGNGVIHKKINLFKSTSITEIISNNKIQLFLYFSIIINIILGIIIIRNKTNKA